MIFLNAVFIFVQTDNAAQNPTQQRPAFFATGETFFFFVFAAELGLRLWVFRIDFFTGGDWRWNLFDCIIVAAAACEEAMKFIEQGSTIAKKATFLRATRILKIGRMTRVFRVVKLFRDLRIMIASIIATLITLFWSIVCLVMIMVTFATYFLTVTADHQANHGIDPELEPFFGSMSATVICLFQITTGGFDWRDMSDLLMAISPLSVGVLCAYISMMQYAILNILTGICCNTANRTAEDDFDITIVEERHRQEGATIKLANYLRENNVSGNGHITWGELERHLKNPQVQSCFKRLDLEHWHLQSFFDILHTDDICEPSISIDNFIRGCKRFRCNVKNIDLIASNYEQECSQKKQYTKLRRKIDAMQGYLMSSSDSLV